MTWKNQGTNGWVSKLMKQPMNQAIFTHDFRFVSEFHESIAAFANRSERTNESVKWRVNQWISECVNEVVNQWMNEWMNQWKNQWWKIDESLISWINSWGNLWYNEHTHCIYNIHIYLTICNAVLNCCCFLVVSYGNLPDWPCCLAFFGQTSIFVFGFLDQGLGGALE